MGDFSTRYPAGGGGAAGINYIDNADFEQSSNGWAVSGTGFAALALDSSTPLRGTQSLQFSADNAATTGIVSAAFTIDTADVGKQLTISFDWRTSAAYVAGDVELVINPDTGADITPSITALPATNTSTTSIKVTFNTTTETGYTLEFRKATAAQPYDCTIDQVQVGPESAIEGVPVTEWVLNADWDVNNFGAVTDIEVYERRVGDTIQIRGQFQVVSISASTGEIQIPSYYTIDTSKFDTQASSQQVGEIQRIRNGGAADDATINSGVLFYDGSTDFRLFFSRASGSGQLTKTASNGLAAASDRMTFQAEFPVSEWAGSTQSLANTRVEYAHNSDLSATPSVTSSGFAYGPAGSNFSSNWSTGTTWNRRVRFQSPIQSTDVIKIEVSQDSGVTWNETAGTIMSSPIRQSSTNYGMTVTTSAGTAFEADVKFASGGREASSTYGANGATWSALSSNIYRWRVVKSSNPLSVGTGVARVLEKYYLNTPSAAQGVILHETEVFANYPDSYNSGTGEFTVFRAGKYRVSMGVSYVSATYSAGDTVQARIQQNGSNIATNINRVPAGTFTDKCLCTTVLNCVVGDTIRTVSVASGGGNHSGGDISTTWMEIEEISPVINGV